MRRIIKRMTKRDARGRVVDQNVERLSDDGNGRLYVHTQGSAVWCRGCGRLVADSSELRGRCDHCGRGGICSTCEARCRLCSRRLCGRCRRGFVGRIAVTVCPICLVRLHQRQAWLDRQALRQAAYARQMQLRREAGRIAAMRLQARRFLISSQMAAQRETNRVRMAISRMRLNALRRLR